MKNNITKPARNYYSFEEMDFHDVRIYGIKFIKEKFKISFDIDYILEWYLNDVTKIYDKYLVASADLIFHNYFDLKIDIFQTQTFDLLIDNIEKEIGIESKTTSINMDKYCISLNCGTIKFLASDIELSLRSNPIISSFQELGISERC